MGVHWQRLAGWLEDEAATPIAKYREPTQILAQRAAAAALLGDAVDQYSAEFELLTEKVQGVVEYADMVATGLLVSKSVDEIAHKCLALYSSELQGVGDSARTDSDDAALGVAVLARRPDVAQAARAHRVTQQLERPTAFSAELLFLAEEARSRTTDDALLFSTVRGIHHAILIGVKRTVAPFVCAFGAVAGSETYARLQGALRRYDELSFADEKMPYRVLPQRLELPAREQRIRLFALGTASGFRLDVIDAPLLVDSLPATFDLLRRELGDKEKRRFDKLHKTADTELEIVIGGVSRVEGADIFSRRVSAALALMSASGYAIEKVTVTTRAEKD